jgi:hypothetical protein
VACPSYYDCRYGGGYAQHVFWGQNTIRNVWGNDREVMTFDNRGNQFFGPVASVGSGGTNITTSGRGATTGNGNGYDVRGGALVVINGASFRVLCKRGYRVLWWRLHPDDVRIRH